MISSFMIKPTNLCLGLFWSLCKNTTAPSEQNAEHKQEILASLEQVHGDSMLSE